MQAEVAILIEKRSTHCDRISTTIRIHFISGCWKVNSKFVFHMHEVGVKPPGLPMTRRHNNTAKHNLG